MLHDHSLSNLKTSPLLPQVHDLMDDIAEQQEIANEISEAISSPMGFGEGMMDDEDLLAELEAMEQEVLDETVSNFNIFYNFNHIIVRINVILIHHNERRFRFIH